eukprot:7124021-Prymnesium_polylepis.1
MPGDATMFRVLAGPALTLDGVAISNLTGPAMLVEGGELVSIESAYAYNGKGAVVLRGGSFAGHADRYWANVNDFGGA